MVFLSGGETELGISGVEQEVGEREGSVEDEVECSD